MTALADGHAASDVDRTGCSATVHACLDLLDARRDDWARRSDEHIEGDIEVYTAAPANAAELIEGAAMMLFLAERRA